MVSDESKTALERRQSAQGIVPQMLILYRAFIVSPQRNGLIALACAMVAIVGLTAFGQARLNAWNEPFYDALSRKNFGAFMTQLGAFFVIAGALLVLNVSQTYLNQRINLKLREGLTRHLIDQWLKPRRAFRLAHAGEIGVNPDQRIHEDARHLTELSTGLSVGLLQATLLLFTFVGILWGLSEGVVFHVQGRSFTIPGYMVWAALFYAGAASLLSWRVGRPLIRLNAERYAREADLRFALVQANERPDGISLYGAEANEERHLNSELDRLLDVVRRIVNASTRLAGVTAGYGWFTLIAPIIVAAPGYFGGDLTFGGLMMAVGAFNQVQQSLRWYVDNFGTIADWRATLLRIASFDAALEGVDAIEEGQRIEFAQSDRDVLILDDVGVAASSDCLRIKERQVEIAASERVVIVSEPGVEKALFFQALAGLWPWGAGRIELPQDDGLAFVPRRPYFPRGSLRAALAYPSQPEEFSEEAYFAVLEKFGLGRLASALDRTAIWPNELTDDEQQMLAFARLALRRPRWIVINEALDALDDDARRVILEGINDDLAGSAVINFGRRIAHDQFFTQVLHLVKDPHGPTVAMHRPAVPKRREARRAVAVDSADLHSS